MLRDASDWLERYAFDRELGLFGRYYDGETPLSDSRGDGWDDAVGSPAERFRTELRGRVVTRSYDLNANLYAWGCYVMLAAMDEAHAAEYLAKARALEAKLRPWLATKDRLPDYGELRTREGDLVRATPREMGMGDYLWALTLTPFAGEVFEARAAAPAAARRARGRHARRARADDVPGLALPAAREPRHRDRRRAGDPRRARPCRPAGGAARPLPADALHRAGGGGDRGRPPVPRRSAAGLLGRPLAVGRREPGPAPAAVRDRGPAHERPRRHRRLRIPRRAAGRALLG